MTPTPLFRPYSIYVSKRVHWALRTVSRGLVGNSPVTPELTPDGIADTLLTKAIESKWPGLLDGFAKRSQVDADYIAMVEQGAKDAVADAAIIKAKGQL